MTRKVMKRLTFEDACTIYDCYQSTGNFPEGTVRSKDEHNELMKYYGLLDEDDDNDLDPAGGHGLHSHA